MANTKTAIKRMRQSEINRQRNNRVKTRVKNAIKSFLQALEEGDMEKAAQNYSLVKKIMDKAVTKGVINKNTAARKKSRLAKQLNRLAS